MLAASSGPAGTRLLGLGHYRPANVITNNDLIARGVDTDDEWIKSRVGIAERRWADPNETVVDMAEAAASKALANSGLGLHDVDLVIVATCTMPTPVPAAAPQLSHRLGIDAPAAFDISSGCSGFVYALSVASAAILTGHAKNALVVGCREVLGLAGHERPQHLHHPRRRCGRGRRRPVRHGRDRPDRLGQRRQPARRGRHRRAQRVLPAGGPGGVPLGHRPDGRGRARGLPPLRPRTSRAGGVRPAPGQPADHRLAGQAPGRT